MIDDGLVALFKGHKREQMEFKLIQQLVYEDQDVIFVENNGQPRVMNQSGIAFKAFNDSLDLDKHIPPPTALDILIHPFSLKPRQA